MYRPLSSDSANTSLDVRTIHGKLKKQKFNDYRRPLKQGNNSKNERNNFKGNVGAARSMKAMGFKDNDDPALTHIFGKGSFPDPGRDPRDSLEDLFEETADNLKELRLNKVNCISKTHLKQILHKKNFYPDPVPPSLLTWTEKQTIRHLHDTEPGEWTAKKLSECFPTASEKVIKYELKNRNPPSMNSVKAKEHDDNVRQNWRLLTQGKLNDKLGDDLYNHLIKSGPSLAKGGNLSTLSNSSLRQLEETMLKVQNDSRDEIFRITPRSAKGPFGSIIADYQKKVEYDLAIQKGNETETLAPAVIEGKHFLKDGDNPNQARDPRRGTSLINVDIDLKREVPMTMTTFKDIFKENLEDESIDSDYKYGNASTHLRFNPVAKMSNEFLKWIHTEEQKNKRAEHRVVSHNISKEPPLVKNSANKPNILQENGTRSDVKRISVPPKQLKKFKGDISSGCDSKEQLIVKTQINRHNHTRKNIEARSQSKTTQDWSRSKWIQKIRFDKY